MQYNILGHEIQRAVVECQCHSTYFLNLFGHFKFNESASLELLIVTLSQLHRLHIGILFEEAMNFLFNGFHAVFSFVAFNIWIGESFLFKAISK